MARPIKETPILFGEDARRFQERMENPPKETLEKREERLRHYQMALLALERGKKEREEGRVSDCIIRLK